MFGLNWITIAVIASLGLLVGVQEMRVQSLKTDHAEYITEVEKATRIATEAALAEQTRRQQIYDNEADHARTEIKDLEATVVQLASDGDRVRDELAAFQSRHRPQSAPAGRGKSEPDPDPLALLAILLDRADREAAELGGYADRLRLAGAACERISDQVN